MHRHLDGSAPVPICNSKQLDEAQKLAPVQDAAPQLPAPLLDPVHHRVPAGGQYPHPPGPGALQAPRHPAGGRLQRRGLDQPVLERDHIGHVAHHLAVVGHDDQRAPEGVERLFELLDRYLGANGCEVAHAADGPHGLARLAQDVFDVVPLFDDGTSGDDVADDGIYQRDIERPACTGCLPDQAQRRFPICRIFRSAAEQARGSGA